MPNPFKRFTRAAREEKLAAEMRAVDVTLQLLREATEAILTFDRTFERGQVTSRNQDFGNLISLLDSKITNKEVDKLAVNGLLFLQSKAIELGPPYYTEARIAELVKLAPKYEMVEGYYYEGFKQDKQEIKSYREQLEKVLENLSSGSG